MDDRNAMDDRTRASLQGIAGAFLSEEPATRLRGGEADLGAFLPDAPGFEDGLQD
ncbi:hypothetical protein [Actinoallomurus iriomotensis]|uniref:Uncharacterized protein n=1 Tax=Actinoallomurus iriomotensis TaxID=478107 RepID=A0A9W6RVX8_9ACTN|nr:hypothetical protein [Actinoallomurus iriomotensis]GLY83636.1 hypothetical protein Airi02_015650 [Actinoallomurus iriomotensis]